jgi:hypothetical protein
MYGLARIGAGPWPGLGQRARSQAWRFHCFYLLVAALAVPKAVSLYLQLLAASPGGIRWPKRDGTGAWKAVCEIAGARLVRRVHRRTGCRPSPVVVWPQAIPSSCVIAFFHSTWDLVIARQLRSRHYCLVRTGPAWARDLGQERVDLDGAGLMSLIRRVARGHRCLVAMDDFVENDEVGFLGARKSLNPAAARFAALTRTPLVPVWPVYERGVLSFALGAPIAAVTCAERRDEAVRLARSFFEHEVEKDPAGWRWILKFLEADGRSRVTRPTSPPDGRARVARRRPS